MVNKNKAAKKKKKGPKGKKARAKAKLDRQWGEQCDNTTTNNNVYSTTNPSSSSSSQGRQQQRRGSRLPNSSNKLTESSRQKHNAEDAAGADDDNDYNSSDWVSPSSSFIDPHEDVNSSEEEEQQQQDVQAFTQLLSALQQRRDDNDGDGDGGAGGSSAIDGGSTSSDDDDDDDDNRTGSSSREKDRSRGNTKAAAAGAEDCTLPLPDQDPFMDRFSRAPLPDDDNNNNNSNRNNKQNNSQKAAAASAVEKVTVGPHLDVYFSRSQTNRSTKDGERSFLREWLCLSSRQQKLYCQVYWDRFYQEASTTDWRRRLFRKQRAAMLFPLVTSYRDLFLLPTTDRQQQHKKKKSGATVLLYDVLAWHVHTHVMASRQQIAVHNQRLKKNKDCGLDDYDPPKDQGYTRPTVLVLLPTRHTCWEFLNLVLGVTEEEDECPGMDRFRQEYGPPPTDVDQTNNTAEARHRLAVLARKDAAWTELFGDDRNDDDDFQIGLQLSKNSKKKLYTNYRRSDVICASPLALKLACQSSNNSNFLSSIELCLVAHAHVLLHQNWDHVNDVMAMLNLQPTQHDSTTDFSRVRPYLLAGQAARWRQLIVVSDYTDPAILSTFKRYAKSMDGMVRFRPKYDSSDLAVSSSMRQVWTRIPCESMKHQSDVRLQYFVDKLLPYLQDHTMIFIPSYFDFCSVRNVLLKKETIDFCSVTEYSRVTEVSRGRARFLQGQVPLLLYTGRAHFFLRHAIKGVKHVVFLGIPEDASFYSEHVNRLREGLKGGDDEDCSCTALFTKYDAHAVERIVGTDNCTSMMKGEKSTFIFSAAYL